MSWYRGIALISLLATGINGNAFVAESKKEPVSVRVGLAQNGMVLDLVWNY